MRIISFLLLLSLPFCALSQLTLVPIPHSAENENSSKISQARVEATTPLTLPFWDDFSYYSKKRTKESLWASYATVNINDGMAVNPLSLKVATFDGYNTSGKPYNTNDNGLVKGFADSLVSQPINLSLVPEGKRSTVYFSFYYQPQGNGEVPDIGDRLVIYFKSPLGWEEVDAIENNSTIPTNDFTFKILSVSSRFFHEKFQFKIRNFGRLSGPYDSWNIDYVYLNVDRNATDLSTPDRALTKPISSFFKDYWSIPYKHFAKNPASNTINPSVDVFNFSSVSNQQPLFYDSYDSIIQYSAKDTLATIHKLDSNQTIGKVLLGRTRTNFTLAKIPNITDLNKKNVAVEIKMKLILRSKDNQTDDPQSDYFSGNFKPIDFRNNDTLRATYKLADYYAYDDGEAEYGAGVNQTGAELAYLFNMKTTEPDTIKAVNIYFPNFADQSSQLFELRIWKTISDTAPNLIYKQTVKLNRTLKNTFTTYDLDVTQPVIVQGSFYVGWKQTSANRIDVGFDANSDSGDQIFYNTSGTWTKNTLLKGSMMVRPVFGKLKTSLVTKVDNEIEVPAVYPNPSTGYFFAPTKAEQIQIYDITGKPVDFLEQSQDDKKRIEINNRTGLFIIRMLVEGQWIAQRILIN